MKLYYVTNGYTGNGTVGMHVIAFNEVECEDVASLEFRTCGEREGYGGSYWTDLKIEYIREFEHSPQVVCWNEE